MKDLKSLRMLAAVVACTVALGCKEKKSEPAPAKADLSELWVNPTDLESRDLYYGPGGKELAPDSNGRFKFLKPKTSGRNPGYTATDAQGRQWSVKLGVESRVEVAVSRIVWAVGYHQPAVYFVKRWTLTDSTGKDSVQQSGRFRLETEEMKTDSSRWEWRENPFVGTKEFAGLFALMIMFTNWDLKADQNAIYETGKGSSMRRRYVVKDLGASLGQSGWLDHTKDDPDGFDKEPFITGVKDTLVTFGFKQSWRDPGGQDVVRPADLRWICGLLKRLSEKQWQDAFLAGGFTKPEADRYIRRLKQKIADGLAVAG